jgi:hypothetical protein
MRGTNRVLLAGWPNHVHLSNLSASETAQKQERKPMTRKRGALTADLACFRWKNRPLLVFAPDAEDLRYSRFSEWLRAMADEAADRDMVVLEVFEQGRGKMTRDVISEDIAARLRQRFRIEPGDFAVILVGKDGGEKLREEEPVALEAIFALIDSMPMRQEKMRRRGRH